MKNSLSNCLLNLGFTKVEVNAKDILLTYREVNGEIYIVAAFFLYTGEELTIEQHQHILFQIKRDFVNRGYQTVHLLSILCTGNPNKVKEFCLPPDNHWVIFLPAKKLIIYENQTPDFIGLKAAIEDLLVNKNDERETTSLSGQNHKGFSDLKKGLAMLTLMNTIIVGLNIVIFMIVRNTNLFGGMEGMWKNWSCNWYPIRYQKEYYRIISSMFLHANTSHLFNNMVILIFIGGYFERAVGRIRYLLIYLGSGIVAGISSVVYNMIKNNLSLAVGASGAIFGIVGAMLYVILVNKGKVEDIGTSRMILFIILSLYGGIVSADVDNAAHIGGFIGGFLLALILYRKPKKNVTAI